MDSCNQIASTSTCRRPKSFELNKRIFLSHSRKDKPFVRRLYKTLKEIKYDVFSYEDIFPKSERIIVKDILEEVEISELCVFVLSDAFFTVTKNPMLELCSFLTAQNKDAMKRILPLFYKLNVPQFKDKQRQCKWIEKWEKWEEEIKGKGTTISDVNIEKWKEALKIIGETNGVELKESNEEQYIEDVVSHICRIIAPCVQDDVSYVQGKERMCREVDDLFVECEKDPAKACILGIHGLGGLGKTTLSKVLFNYYWPQFEGHVVRVELDSPCKERTLQQLRMVLKTIKNTHEETLASLHDVDQAWKLHLDSTGRKKIFLIIDNANLDCKEEIGKYLKGIFDGESRILIFSRSRALLKDLCLGYPNFHLAKMPSLRKEEAETLFLHSLQIFGKEHELSTIKHDIMRDGIELCRFEGVYHPMAVLVLGSWMKRRNWESVVASWSRDRTSQLGSTVINLFKKSFDDMGEKIQRILLDIALYRPSQQCNLYEWLSFVNEIDLVKVDYVLTELRDRAFLCGDGLEIHELVKELAVLAARSNTSLGCLYFDKKNQPWERIGDNGNARNVRFAMESCEIPISTLSLKGCHCLRAVKIKDIKGLKEIEMEKNMVFLQSLEVSSSEFMNRLSNDDEMMSKKKPHIAKIMIKSLACCVNLKWISLENCVDSKLMQPQLLCRLMSLVGSGSRFNSGQSLRSLRIATNQRFTFPLQTLDECCKSLEKLELDGFDVGKSCHLPKFSQLRSLSLTRCLSTHELHFGSLSRLEEFVIKYAPKLKRICGLDGCASSSPKLTLVNISSLECLDLSSLPHLSGLYIDDCKKLNSLDGLEKTDSLKSMLLEECDGLVRLEGLEKLHSLEFMQLDGCGLVRLEGLEKIDSLQHLHVYNCHELVSLFEGAVIEDGEIASLANLGDMRIEGCPNLTEKFAIVNVKSFESDNSEYVESVLFAWNAFLRALKERECSSPTALMTKDSITRWNQELVVGAISQPQTISVTPSHIPYHRVLTYFCADWYSYPDDYVKKAMEGFLKMLMVALCWSSQEYRMDITKQLQASKCIITDQDSYMPKCLNTMTQYLSLVHPMTLLTCLIYLWCHGQVPSFLVILKMAGGMDAIFKTWDQAPHLYHSRKYRIQHGILLLAVVGIMWPKHLPDWATHIATIYLSTLLDMKIVLDKNSDLMDMRLPIVAKDAMVRLLNEQNVQTEFRNVQREVQKDPSDFKKKRLFRESIKGVDNLEVFNRLLYDIPCCYDLECFLSYTNSDL